MRKRIALLLFAALPLFGDVKKLVDEGVALYDIGRYDAAIAKFKTALEEDPSSELAAYELGMTYSAKGDNAECIALLEPLAARKQKLQVPMLGILGNCYDASGDSDRAIRTYRKALKIDGNDAQALYNLAITLTGRGENDEARKLLKKELALRPDHGSGYYALGLVFEAQNFRMPAALTYLRFLSLENEGERAKDAARRALALMSAGMEVKDEHNVEFRLDAKPRKEEGDYAGLEFFLGLAAAVPTGPEEPGTEFERRLQQVSTSLELVAETMKPGGRHFMSQQIVPWIQSMYDKKQLDAFAAIALQSLDLPGESAWMAANREAVEALRK